MRKRDKGSRGKIIFDEGADRRLVKLIRSTGWRVQGFSPRDRNIRLRDEVVAQKYAQGRFPILTTDHLAYNFNPQEKGAIGYVELESVPPEKFEEYTLKVIKFFSSHTAGDIRGRVWRIPLRGDPM